MPDENTYNVKIENLHIEGHSIPCTVYFKNGKKERRRFVNARGCQGMMVKRKRRNYYPLYSGIYFEIEKIVLHENAKEKSVVETIRSNATRFLQLLDNRLWQDLRIKVTGVLENLDKDYQEWERIPKETRQSFTSWFWDKYHEEWLYRQKLFITVNTVFGNKYGTGAAVSRDIEKYLSGIESDFEKARIADTIDKKGTYLYYSNRYGYDNSIEVSTEKGKAWLSREYQGCGNGHYYLLLSPTHAIHYEDD